MKVSIGPYVNYYSSSRLRRLYYNIKYNGENVLEDLKDKWDIAFDWFTDNIVDKFCYLLNFRYNKKQRKISVKIDRYDVWNADHTMALVILPILKAVKEDKYSGCMVSNEDVPEALRTTKEDDEKLQHNGTIDDNYHNRWNYVLDEMIWAFERIVDQDDISEPFNSETYLATENRISNGTLLFGKYYRGLWT
jgi:hypothetical protein